MQSFGKPETVKAALRVANTSFDELDAVRSLVQLRMFSRTVPHSEVEMLGGGWRIPKIQSLLVNYLKAW